MDRVYLETSVVSYWTSRPSRDLIIAGHQQITRDWWNRRRSAFELFVSRIVVDEASEGDPQAAGERLVVLRNVPVLQLNRAAVVLAREFLDAGALPAKAGEDALHVAVATVHGMDFLLTWNCRHIANAEMTRAVNAICTERGYEMPVICTPEELMGE